MKSVAAGKPIWNQCRVLVCPVVVFLRLARHNCALLCSIARC